jgi:hypothetical protein
MMQSEDNAVRDPIPFPKDAIHLGQKYSAEQEFFAQEVVEHRRDHEEREETPCANPARLHFRGEQGIQAAALGFRQEGEEPFTTGHFLEVFLNCYSLRDTTYF